MLKLITCYSSFKFSKGQLRAKWPYNETSWEGSMHSTWVWSTRQGGGGCGCCPLPPTVTQHPHISTVTSGQRPRVTYPRHSQPPSQHKSDLCTAKITFTTYIHVYFAAQDEPCTNNVLVKTSGTFIQEGSTLWWGSCWGKFLGIISNLLYSRRVRKMDRILTVYEI